MTITYPVPLSEEVLIALAANAYATERPMTEWVEWALRVKYGKWT